MHLLFQSCYRLLAVMMIAAGVAVVQALTLGELAEVFPRHRIVENRALVFLHDGVRYVALANGKKEVGIILLLPEKLSNYQKLEELADRFRKLIPDGERDFRVETFNYKGKTSQALINTQLLSSMPSKRNRWMGVPLFHCLVHGIGRCNGRIAAVSEDSITMEVPHDQYGRMRVTVYLLSLSEVQLVDVVSKRKSRKSYDNAVELALEFDFYYRTSVDEQEARDLKREYMINRPLVYGRFYTGAHYATYPSYVAVEGNAFRIGTARAFRELRSRKDLDPLAYTGEESPMPEKWPESSAGRTGRLASSPSAGAGGASDASSGTASGQTALGGTQNPALASQPGTTETQGSPQAQDTGRTVIFYDPATALEAYKEALRHL